MGNCNLITVLLTLLNSVSVMLPLKTRYSTRRFLTGNLKGMKLCRFVTFEEPDQPRSGFLHEHHIYETNGQEAQGVYRLDKINLLTPFINPPTVKLMEQTDDHLWYTHLNPMGLMPTESQFHIPGHAHKLGVEVRPAVVINASGEFVEPHEAHTFILGFVLIVNFIDLNLIEKEKALGITSANVKDFDFVLGPLLITPDELLELHRDQETSHRYQWNGSIKLNGEIIQNLDSIQKVGFTECILKASETQGINKAEIVCSTPINQPLDPTILKPGDKLTVQVTGLGGIQVSLT